MNYVYSTGNRIVDEVSEMNITGDVIPATWFKTMRGPNGKPMLLAINILSDITYWYRAKEIRDENTGDLIRFQKKFKADLLQRSYRQIEERFGVSKKQARTALDFLCEIGVIKKHLRNECTKDGMQLHNNMYLELVPTKLRELTYPSSADMGVPSGALPCVNEDITLGSYMAEGDYSEVTTSTDITTQNTTRDFKPSINQEDRLMDEMEQYRNYIYSNLDYENLIQDIGFETKAQVEELVELIIDIVSIPRKTVRIAGQEIPYQVVKSKFCKLKREHIEYVLESLSKNRTEIKNIRCYLLTTLYNAPETMESYTQAFINHDIYKNYGL